MNTQNTFFIMVAILATQSLHPGLSIEIPTSIVQINGVEPINAALDKTNLALDKANITIDKLKQLPHSIGIMMLGAYIGYLGIQRFNNNKISNDWTNIIKTGLLVSGGLFLTITAPFIASKINRLAI